MLDKQPMEGEETHAAPRTAALRPIHPAPARRSGGVRRSTRASFHLPVPVTSRPRDRAAAFSDAVKMASYNIVPCSH